VGGTLQQCAVARPNREIEAVRPSIIEKTCDLRRKPDFARPRMHFRADAWRQKLRSAMRRRTINSAVEAGLARPAIVRRASPTEVRRRTAAHSAIECGHPALQLFVDLFELVDALQLIDRGTESGQNADQEKREPHLQAPADGFDDHDRLGKPPAPPEDSPSSTISGLVQYTGVTSRRFPSPRPSLLYVFSAMVGMARCAVPARVEAGGTNIRATPGNRKTCAAARGADIAARCPYHAKQILSLGEWVNP